MANQLGRQRTLCEAYGAGGWDLRFEDMKRIGDWLYVLGVNTLDEHLSYITIRGARSATIRSRSPTTSRGGTITTSMAEYFTRLSLALSRASRSTRPGVRADHHRLDVPARRLGRERVEAMGDDVSRR